MLSNTLDTFYINIHMAGDVTEAKRICSRYCLTHSLCVTVKEQTFCYTGGVEEGFVVGLINYPKFPTKRSELWMTATELAELLRVGLGQHSFLLQATDKTEWVSRRDENVAAR